MIRVLITVLTLAGCGSGLAQTKPPPTPVVEVWEQGSPIFDPGEFSTVVYTVLDRWKGRDLSAILPDLTLERMGMVLTVELQTALPPGLLLFSLELDHGPARITVIPSLGS